MYVNYIILLIQNVMKFNKVGNENLTTMLERFNEFINEIIMSFCKTEIKLEYAPKNLANEIVKKIYLLFGRNEETEFQKIVQECLEQVKNGIKDVLLIDSNLFSFIKKLFSEFINEIIMSFCKTEIKLEYEPKILANKIVKEICLLFGKKEEAEFQKIVQQCLQQVKNGIKHVLLSDNNLISFIKKLIQIAFL